MHRFACLVLLTALIVSTPVSQAADDRLSDVESATTSIVASLYDIRAAHPHLFEDPEPGDADLQETGPLLTLHERARQLSAARFHASLELSEDDHEIPLPESEVRAWMEQEYRRVDAMATNMTLRLGNASVPAPGLALETLVYQAWPAYHLVGNREFQERQFMGPALPRVNDARYVLPIYHDIGAREVLMEFWSPPTPHAENNLTMAHVGDILSRAGIDFASRDPDVLFPARRAEAAMEEGRAFDALMFLLVAQYGASYSEHAEPALQSDYDAVPVLANVTVDHEGAPSSLALRHAREIAARVAHLDVEMERPHRALSVVGADGLAWYDIVDLIRGGEDLPRGIDGVRTVQPTPGIAMLLPAVVLIAVAWVHGHRVSTASGPQRT